MNKFILDAAKVKPSQRQLDWFDMQFYAFVHFTVNTYTDLEWGLGDEDEKIDYNLNFTFNKAQKRVVNAAISNTFGFGGHNTSIAFKKI